MKLQPLIDDLKLGFVSRVITDENFPYKELPQGRYGFIEIPDRWTTKEILEHMESKNVRPATLHELLQWAAENWNEMDWVVALGSVWQHKALGNQVAFIKKVGEHKWLDLGTEESNKKWLTNIKFLAVSTTTGFNFSAEKIINVGGYKIAAEQRYSSMVLKDKITYSTPRGNLLQVAWWAMQRELAIRKQKTFVYCPKCKFEMCSMNNAMGEKDGTVYHVCKNCGAGSKWNYDLPAPMNVT